ncbi:FAD-binding protein [Spirosoma sp.]|uniref:FAD-binding protein n=1 Tax=Spirosoma sp. TaxID=1899569 RepID=UPI0026066630|nr:FAD-binding protein [Spirosoma sp.]MCX6218291.1 FAD-binding protein [Spirosoma sp.]
MAQITTHHVTDWNNYHFNGPYPTKCLFDIDTNRTIVSLIDRYTDSASSIQGLISDSLANNERFRAYGSAWSLSNVAHQRDRMLFNANLNIRLEIKDSQLHPSTTYQSENLFLFQCGNTIKEISEFLQKKGKSLKTCGASNGQTIAGAISTGVHGSSIDVGSVQDCVVGLQLIIGPNANDRVYIERESRPALSDEFARRIQSRVIRSDDLFNAALVSLGAFGVIHGVVLEAEDLYLLKRYVKKISKADALQIAATMDFANARFKLPDEVLPDGTVNRPFHYKLYINPYNASEDFVTEIIYKKPYRTGYPNPVPFVQNAIFKDIPTWVSAFAAKHKRIIPRILDALKSEAFPKVDDTIEGTLGEIFWDTSQSSAAFGCGFGIDIADSPKALDLFIDLMNDKGPIPGILSMRFVKASEATLGFTRFPTTCILEVDGVPWKGNQNMISLDDFLTDVIKTFKDSGIAFTLHWGKNAPWSFPNLIDLMYGNADDKWKDMRSILLSKEIAHLFSNDFLSTVNLADYRVNIAPDFVALRDAVAASVV